MSGLGAVRLVARREITERVRERSFAISTAITLVVLLAIVLVPRLTGIGDDDPAEIAVAGPRAAQLAAALEAQGGAKDAVEVGSYSSVAAAERAVADGAVEAALVPGRIVVENDLSDDLQARLQGASASVRAQAALERNGVTGPEAQAILAPAPLPVAELEPDDGKGGNEGLAFIAVFVLYGQIIGYGFWVAAGVIEEKASRVVEIVLSTITPRQLLAGKVLGIGLLGLVQLLGLAAVTFVAAIASDAIDNPGEALGTIGVVLGFFVLGYAFYACVFAAAASAVQRQEDLQNATTPLTVVIVASLVLSIVAINNPDGTLAQVFSIVPPFSAIVMPPRIAAGDASALQIVLAIALLAAAVAALIPIAARIYSHAVLRTRGRVGLREAWRSGS